MKRSIDVLKRLTINTPLDAWPSEPLTELILK